MSDIVVRGKRINYGGEGAGGGFYEHPHMNGDDHPSLSPDGGGGAPDEPNDHNTPCVAAEVTDPNNKDKIERAALLLVEKIEKLTPLIASVPNAAKLRFKDGTGITGAQLKALWNKADFLVTDRTFGKDRGGATEGYLSKINVDTALGWDVIDKQRGVAFIIVHEVIHMTDQARSYNAMCYGAHQAVAGSSAPYDADSPNFVRNEQFVNHGAREVARLFGASSEMELPERLSPDGDTRKHVPTHGY